MEREEQKTLNTNLEEPLGFDREMFKLSIIILNYNTKNLVLKCIRGINDKYSEQLKNNEFEIIVVDNNSSDDSVAQISRLRQDYGGQANLKLIKNEKNLGFSKGCNAGAWEARGENLLFLNSDIEVSSGGFLEMVQLLERQEKIGILGGRLLNPDGSSQLSAGKFYTLINFILMIAGLERFASLRKSPKEITKVDWVSGACLMIKKSLFDKLKGFDEQIFMYTEDMELCFRAGKIGFLTYFYPNISLVHKEHASSSRSFAIIHIYHGILHFYKKHKSYWQYLMVKSLLITKALIAVCIGTMTNNNYLKKSYGEALRISL